MKDDSNVSQVKSQLDELTHLFKNASTCHESLLLLIPPDEKDKQNVWFSSITKFNRGFIEDITMWHSDVDKRPHRPKKPISDAVQPQDTPLEGEIVVQENTGMEPSLFVSQHNAQDDVLPSDSISNQGSRSSSKVSTTSSVCLRAEAEVAALLTRQRMLKEKHAIEEQEEQLRRKKEQFQLEADIAANIAKVSVLRTGCSVRSTASQKSNGMESYFQAKEKTLEMFNVDTEPKVETVQQTVKQDKPIPLPKGTSVPSRPHGTIPHSSLQHYITTAQPTATENPCLLSVMQKQN